MSMKNFGDTTENRNRDLPACSSVSQPTLLVPSNCRQRCNNALKFKIIGRVDWKRINHFSKLNPFAVCEGMGMCGSFCVKVRGLLSD